MENKRSANGWIRIAGIRSESDAGKWYMQGLRALANGKIELGCDCKAHLFYGNKNPLKQSKAVGPYKGFPKCCKHNRALMDGTVSLSNLDLTPDGVAFLDAYKALAGVTNEVERNSKALAVAKSVGMGTVAKVG